MTEIRHHGGADPPDDRQPIDLILGGGPIVAERSAPAQEFEAKYSPVDVLINNAGAIMLSRRYSVDNIEMTPPRYLHLVFC